MKLSFKGAWKKLMQKNAYKFTDSRGAAWYLHMRLAKNGTTPFYFFAKTIKEAGAVSIIPDGYDVKETEKTGMPILFRPGKIRKEKKIKVAVAK